MKLLVLCATALFLASASASFSQNAVQGKHAANSAPASNFTADYPKDGIGVLIDNSGWTAVPQVFPSKTRVSRGIAASLTYGAVPAKAVSEYDGLHSAVQVTPGRPILCICHFISLPGPPTLVKLHSKKNSRELDGGRLPVLGAKISEATKSDLVDADVSQPESTVWLVRPREPLLPGEYALMLGTQNVSIFAFTVSSARNDTAVSSPDKH